MADFTAARQGSSKDPLPLKFRDLGDGTAAPVVSIEDEGSQYQEVAASQTKALLGASGAVGDHVEELLITPATLSPGAVTLYDGNGSALPIFIGGATSVADLKPFTAKVGANAKNATTPGWYLTTGANVTVIAVGKFT